MKVIFWITVATLFYVYLGYCVFLYLLSLLKKKLIKIEEILQPPVTLIIAAFNEEKVISDKIKNSLELNYPGNNLEIIVFSDASSDSTDEIVKNYSDKGVKLLRVEGRKGKTYCQNEAVKIASGEIIVFSDANSMYEPNAIYKLVRNFAEPIVGCVSGELKYRKDEKAVEGEKTYWQYDQILKRLESKVSSLVTANGAIYAVRRSLYEPLKDYEISDFIEPLKIFQKGYRVIYEPEAVAWEHTSEDPSKEKRRRIRIVMRSVYSLLRDRSLLGLLNPLKYGIFSIQLWSHKILRWFSGLFLFLIFITNIFLIKYGIFYRVTLMVQGAVYVLALWGFISDVIFKRKAPKFSHIAYYFCLSCYSMLVGVYNGIKGRTFVAWKPVR